MWRSIFLFFVLPALESLALAVFAVALAGMHARYTAFALYYRKFLMVGREVGCLVG